ncbi:MAG: hypothetical protein LBT46_09235 [Planctomycetaceae bacterium]|jgi:hypothetical protein|nr:hypothetical protein [Planctomycetaceae bacterium]
MKPTISLCIIHCALCVILLSGCGGPEYGYVTGKVLIDGEPAGEGLVVHFQPQDKSGSYSAGITDAGGNYELWFSNTVRGVQLGTSKITVKQQQSEDLPQPKTLPFLAAFNKDTALVYDVKRGSQTYDVVIDTSVLPVEKKKR